jgi:hypothetical protein
LNATGSTEFAIAGLPHDSEPSAPEFSDELEAADHLARMQRGAPCNSLLGVRGPRQILEQRGERSSGRLPRNRLSVLLIWSAHDAPRGHGS